MAYRSPWMTEELDIFRDALRRFVAAELTPHAERWREQKMPDRDAWRAAGRFGMLCPSIPEAYGGAGGSFAHEAVVAEELEYGDVTGLAVANTVHSAIVAHYLLAYGSEEQKRRWLPKMASGEWVGAIAMTEPGGGSDLQSLRTRATRRGNAYVLNGQKTFITNGRLADLVVVAAKTDPTQGARGISLFVVEAGSDGFRRGRNLDKIGLHGSDTAELFFDDVLVPPENLLGGEEGRGFYQMMEQLPQERLGLAVGAVAAMERALALTTDYVKARQAFGKPLIEFQNTAFRLAERKTEAHIARVFLDHCIERLIARDLDTVTASMAKWWTSEKQFETVDACLQLHGGYGYMSEFPIARMFVDARVQKIYGGANEVMKVLIARSL